jgi:hypothetical protein
MLDELGADMELLGLAAAHRADILKREAPA